MGTFGYKGQKDSWEIGLQGKIFSVAVMSERELVSRKY